jgi:D-alanine-D-alanine ligase-like ATP-grasp enzyme
MHRGHTLKIAILHPSYEDSLSPMKDMDPECDPSRYLPEMSCSHFRIGKSTAVKQVTEIARQGFDAVINLCDGAWDEDRPGLEVVQVLERFNVAFTGAGSAFYDPSRESMKIAANSAGVSIPAYVMARTVADVDRALSHLRFPMIVKHPHGYSSVGMTKASRVTDADGLRVEVVRLIELFGGALVEEFIEGREFTVLVTEPRVDGEAPWALQPVEFLFPDGELFKHFDLKWVDFESMQTRPVEDEGLALRLREASLLTFEALSGTGYGRCDLRMDSTGEIFLLEINPNCGIFYPPDAFGSADIILSSEPDGHRGFLEHLLFCARRRQQRGFKSWQLHYSRQSGFGLSATRDIAPGEVVVRYEEVDCAMVSRQHVERHWRGLKRQWFERYAWPVSENVFQLWSENPERWRPINHSCDPNLWLKGLDLVARRSIGDGESLTVDYATFCGPSMESFECACGAACCRGTVQGTDYLLPELMDRYGDHVSDFIRSAIRNRGTRLATPYEITKKEVGSGLVARRKWKAEEVVSHLSWGPSQPEPNRWTVQCNHDNHAEPLPFELRYINHSCDPNVFFDVEEHVLRAIKDIAEGDELTFFYPSTEWHMAEQFDCQCGTQNCVGRITGAAHMSLEILQQFRLTNVIRRSIEQGTTPRGALLQ